MFLNKLLNENSDFPLKVKTKTMFLFFEKILSLGSLFKRKQKFSNRWWLKNYDVCHWHWLLNKIKEKHLHNNLKHGAYKSGIFGGKVNFSNVLHFFFKLFLNFLPLFFLGKQLLEVYSLFLVGEGSEMIFFLIITFVIGAR